MNYYKSFSILNAMCFLIFFSTEINAQTITCPNNIVVNSSCDFPSVFGRTHGSPDKIFPNTTTFNGDFSGNNYFWHTCYWKSNPDSGSEGIQQTVNLEGGSDVVYYLDIDVAKGCSHDDLESLNGKFSAHLTNDWEMPNPNNWLDPYTNSPNWFTNDFEIVNSMVLDQSYDYSDNNNTFKHLRFGPLEIDEDYSDLIIFCNQDDPRTIAENVCGLYFDNIELACEITTHDVYLEINHLGGLEYEFIADEGSLDIETFDWDFGDGNFSWGDDLDDPVTHTYDFADDFLVCFNFIDERGCCGQICTELEVEEEDDPIGTGEICTYTMCLDRCFTGGMPIVTSINATFNGISLGTSAPFTFPYCFNTWGCPGNTNGSWFTFVSHINQFIANTPGATGNAYLGGTNDMSDGCRSFILTIENTNINFVSLSESEYTCNFEKKDCSVPFDSDEDVDSRSHKQLSSDILKVELYNLSGQFIKTIYPENGIIFNLNNLDINLPSNLYVSKIFREDGVESKLVFK